MVGRPRPYTYNPDPRVKAYAAGQGKDARLSFYSGHAAMSFAAAVAGSALFAQSTDDTRARTADVGDQPRARGGDLEPARARGQALLQRRAGGGGAGRGRGLGGAVLHSGATPPAGDLRVGGDRAAPLAGALVSQLVPMKQDVLAPLGATRTALVPWKTDGGGGLTLAARF